MPDETPTEPLAPKRGPGKETTRLQRVVREVLGESREESEERDKWEAIKAILTGPAAKWLILGAVLVVIVPALVLGAWATGMGFGIGPQGVWFGSPPVIESGPAAEEAP